jgi:hypothetical protein
MTLTPTRKITISCSCRFFFVFFAPLVVKDFCIL